MSPSDLRTKYLAESSQLLNTTSPSVAAALTVERFAIEDDLSEQQERYREVRCLACGGASVKTRTIWPKQNISHTRKSHKERRTNASHRYRKLIRICRTCKRVVTHTFSAPVKPTGYVTTSTTRDNPNQQDLALPKDAEKTVIKSNTSGKKRAKARREGLQALLNQSKQKERPAHNFTLTDFMRPM